jgi:hypothetical protein
MFYVVEFVDVLCGEKSIIFWMSNEGLLYESGVLVLMWADFLFLFYSGFNDSFDSILLIYFYLFTIIIRYVIYYSYDFIYLES